MKETSSQDWNDHISLARRNVSYWQCCGRTIGATICTNFMLIGYCSQYLCTLNLKKNLPTALRIQNYYLHFSFSTEVKTQRSELSHFCGRSLRWVVGKQTGITDKVAANNVVRSACHGAEGMEGSAVKSIPWLTFRNSSSKTLFSGFHRDRPFHRHARVVQICVQTKHL